MRFLQRSDACYARARVIGVNCTHRYECLNNVQNLEQMKLKKAISFKNENTCEAGANIA